MNGAQFCFPSGREMCSFHLYLIKLSLVLIFMIFLLVPRASANIFTREKSY